MSKHLSVFNDLCLVVFKGWLRCFMECGRFCRYVMHKWPTLRSGHNGAVNRPRMFLCAHDEPSSWPTQRFMGGACYKVSMINRAWMVARCNETSYVCYVGK